MVSAPLPDPAPSDPDRHELRRSGEGVALDELGRIRSVVFLRWTEEVARAHAEAVGVGAARMLAEKAIVVVRRHDLQLLRPAYRDDQLSVTTRVVSAQGLRAVRANRVVRVQTGELIATCLTVWVWINPETGRPQRPPREFMASYGFG
ncbi:acyl-CoA thioesterase [Deinococcus sp.]|uniref:acyl-CoA thioesterase n=1 Tax=Deinococcus sp. TaxID=47478 RepID=UPI003C7D7CD4